MGGSDARSERCDEASYNGGTHSALRTNGTLRNRFRRQGSYRNLSNLIHVTESGTDQFGAKIGSHDDLVTTLGLAVFWAESYDTPVMLWRVWLRYMSRSMRERSLEMLCSPLCPISAACCLLLETARPPLRATS